MPKEEEAGAAVREEEEENDITSFSAGPNAAYRCSRSLRWNWANGLSPSSYSLRYRISIASSAIEFDASRLDVVGPSVAAAAAAGGGAERLLVQP